MAQKSYSQFGQDLNVIEFYHGARNGFFVDIGAFDGIYLSNSYALERDFGWRGICIEPMPDKFEQLQARRTAVCVNAALSSESGERVTFSRPEKGQSFLAGITKHLDGWGKSLTEAGPATEVVTQTLTEVLDANNAPDLIDFLSLDTEGSELEILLGIDFGRYRFGYISLEHNYSEPRRSRMRELLVQHGYLYLGDNECDDDYAHRSVFEGSYYYRNNLNHPIQIAIDHELNLQATSDYWPPQSGHLNPERLEITFDTFGVRRIDGRSISASPADRWLRHPVDLNREFVSPARVADPEQRRELIDVGMAQASGILHLGGHLGQESTEYAAFAKPVLWIEAQPDIFLKLQRRLKLYPDQLAICALLGDSDNASAAFNVSSNASGVSSSLFNFGRYGSGDESLWPEKNLRMVNRLMLPMLKLDTLLDNHRIDPASHDFWVLDVQGAELLVLRGGENALQRCQHLYVEISMVEVYAGGVQWLDLKTWLGDRGFHPCWQPEQAHDDILFSRQASD